MLENKINWQPNATIAVLKERAKILTKIRNYFADNNVLEVETPILGKHGVTDPNLFSITAICSKDPNSKKQKKYLQTSPEFYMKRLLAAGNGSIYQITKAFRDYEDGNFHNIEFTMLEWYRINFTYQELMQDVINLTQTILGKKKIIIKSYKDLFLEKFQINPHQAKLPELILILKKLKLDQKYYNIENKNLVLQILMTEIIEPNFSHDCLFFVYDFPFEQAMLAKTKMDNCDIVAERFELYINGLEIANGFTELTNYQEQKKRMQQDLCERKKLKYKNMKIDTEFLTALKHGLPNCAGVALGVDRLIMLALQKNSIHDVISFT